MNWKTYIRNDFISTCFIQNLSPQTTNSGWIAFHFKLKEFQKLCETCLHGLRYQWWEWSQWDLWAWRPVHPNTRIEPAVLNPLWLLIERRRSTRCDEYSALLFSVKNAIKNWVTIRNDLTGRMSCGWYMSRALLSTMNPYIWSLSGSFFITSAMLMSMAGNNC